VLILIVLNNLKMIECREVVDNLKKDDGELKKVFKYHISISKRYVNNST
jgi:hypothetical protein